MTYEQQLARAKFEAYDAATIAELFRNGPKVNDTDFGFRHGWITVNGKAYDRETCFPERHYPRFPADQGLSD